MTKLTKTVKKCNSGIDFLKEYSTDLFDALLTYSTNALITLVLDGLHLKVVDFTFEVTPIISSILSTTYLWNSF